MLAEAIAKELGLKVLKVNFPTSNRKAIPMIVSYLAEKAKAHESLLLFDECEDMIGYNPYLGLSDSWAKILFEQFKRRCGLHFELGCSPGLSRS